MVRRGLVLLLLAGAALGGGPTLKKLLDPAHPDFPLRPYSWEEWEGLDAETKLRARGVDPARWQEPPPWPETEEERKEREERERKQREEEEKRPPGAKRYPQDRAPGFRFDERLERKQKAFAELVEPASASKLEGLVKQLDLLDKALQRFDRDVERTREEYAQLRDQMLKVQEVYAENYKKKHGRYPDTFPVSASLKVAFERSSRAYQQLVCLRESELAFHDWMLVRIARWVGELSDEEQDRPLKALERGLSDRDWLARLRCARLAARIEGAPAGQLLRATLEKEKDPLVLAELIRLRGPRGGPELFELLAQRLDDESWAVRAAVVRELGRLPRRESVDLLVARLQREEGRLRDDIAAALRGLTGQRFLPEPDPWRIWWEKFRDSWTPPEKVEDGGTEEGAAAGNVYFYGIRTSSKRVVFCIDVSGSMEFPLDGRDGKKPPRIESAKQELFQALAALPEDALFSIVVYNAEVDIWKKKMQEASLRNKQLARKFVEKLQPSGSTNIFDALTTCMDIAASLERRKPEDPEADTIFFLTDGVPTHGKIVDPDRILDEITRRNQVLGLVIHAVGVSTEQNRAFLLNLAAKNGGTYVGHK